MSVGEKKDKDMNMRRFLITTLAVALGILTGCVGVASRQPLFPENAKEVVFDTSLLGKWQESDSTTYQVTRLDEKSYAASFEDEGKKPAMATFQLLKVRGVSVLDVAYLDRNDPAHFRTVHFFAKIRIEGDTLHVATLASDWLKKQILATGKPVHERNRLPESSGDEPALMLTAPSAELRKGLLPYLDRPEAYEKETELKRVK